MKERKSVESFIGKCGRRYPDNIAEEWDGSVHLNIANDQIGIFIVTP